MIKIFCHHFSFFPHICPFLATPPPNITTYPSFFRHYLITCAHSLLQNVTNPSAPNPKRPRPSTSPPIHQPQLAHPTLPHQAHPTRPTRSSPPSPPQQQGTVLPRLSSHVVWPARPVMIWARQDLVRRPAEVDWTVGGVTLILPPPLPNLTTHAPNFAAATTAPNFAN